MRRLPPAVVLGTGILVVAAIACQSGSENRRPAEWRAHQDPLGFSVHLPPGWRVTADRASGRIALTGTAEEQVIIWPVFIPGALGARAASAALGRLAAKFWPEVGWQAPQPAGATTVRMQGRKRDRLAVAVLAWVPSPKGCAGYVYGFSAPEARYRQSEETFAALVASFRIASPSTGGAAETSARFVAWHDPREQAFSVEVPAGWTVSGGLFRLASVDVRPSIEVVSPDGKIRLTAGDAEIPGFAVPNPMLEMTGFREGSWYSPGYGVNVMVRRYLPGVDFVREYVMTKVTRGCSDPEVKELRARPEAVEAMNAVYAQYQMPGFATQLTAGDIAFTCRREGEQMEGYYFAATQATQAGPVVQWRVEFLYGYLAAAEQAPKAQAVLEHLIQTFQLNPQWVAMQQGLAANTSAIVAQTNHEISRIISSSYHRRQAVMDELSRRRSNAILGVEDVVDPATGREFKVESGSNYYWIDHRGHIVGTETDTRPSLDFRELVRLP